MKTKADAGQLPLFTSPSDTGRATSFPAHTENGAGDPGQVAGSREKAPWYNPELAKVNTHFLCQSCFTHWPIDDRSPDERYCLYCYEFLSYEAKLLEDKGIKKRPSWVPVQKNAPPKTRRNAMRRTTIKNLAGKNSGSRELGVSQKTPVKNSLSKKLPKRKIRKLAKQGMPPKRIAAELLKQGVITNHRSIARIIANGKGN